MQLTNVTVDSLGELDGGRARGVINAALAAVFADLEDRGHDKQNRKVTITLTIKKEGDSDVSLKVNCAASVPKYAADATYCRLVQKQGRHGPVPMLAFSEFDPANPDQKQLPMMEDE